MAEIILRTEEPNKVSEILKEAIETEKLRVRYSLDITRNRLNRFEQKIVPKPCQEGPPVYLLSRR